MLIDFDLPEIATDFDLDLFFNIIKIEIFKDAISVNY